MKSVLSFEAKFQEAKHFFLRWKSSQPLKDVSLVLFMRVIRDLKHFDTHGDTTLLGLFAVVSIANVYLDKVLSTFGIPDLSISFQGISNLNHVTVSGPLTGTSHGQNCHRSLH
jgi:hypothetical protein